MAGLGLLSGTDEPGRFRVGPDLARIGSAVAEQLDIRREAAAVPRAGGPASLARPSSSPSTIRDRRQVLGGRCGGDEPPGPLPVGVAAGLERPPSRGSPARGSWPSCPPLSATRSSIGCPIRSRAACRPPGPGCAASLRRRDERGYVVSHGERYEGAVGVSAPIRDARGRIAGDLIAAWPDNRTSPAKEAETGAVDPGRRGRPVTAPRLGRSAEREPG